MLSLAQVDPQVAQALEAEDQRQREAIVLIASENYASKAVLASGSSVLSNKYAEGYPGRRYYGGCENADIVESLAVQRVKELFGAEHANVQPHSGAQANMAVYFSQLEPGDTVMGMQLDHGGHLTHGAKVNFSGRLYDFVPYGVNRETEQIDYDEVERLALKHRPKLIVGGCSAYPRTVDFPRLRAIADAAGALLMIDMAHIAGLVAGGAHPSPLPHAQIVTSTTQKSLRGPRGGFILSTGELAKSIDFAVFPVMQGGPMMHTVAGKAVCFGEALQPEFSRYAHQVVANSQAMADELSEAGMRLVSGRHRQPPVAGGRNSPGNHWPSGGAGPAIGRNRRQQERDPLRYQTATGQQRPTPRLSGGYQPGFRRRRHEAGGRTGDQGVVPHRRPNAAR